MVKRFEKKRRSFARALLLIMFFNLFSPYAGYSSNSTGSSGSGPVASAANSMVDPFTGDFNYSVPLLTIPGINGENVNVSASYHAGIRMDEQASWLGLGWDYNPGEISRGVNGVPDDVKGKEIYSAYIYQDCSDSISQNAHFGPLYYDNYNSTPTFSSPLVPAGTSVKQYKSEDVYSASSTVPLGGATNGFTAPLTTVVPYYFPDYDNYHISGPGISGSLRPYLFQDGMILKYNSGINDTYSYLTSNFKKPQFYMENSSDLNNFQNYIDATTNRLKTSYFIKYYTNTEINNNSNLYLNSTKAGFLDYRVVSSGSQRPSSDFDPDGIGGYEIADPNGIIYHYSLPVYSQDEKIKSFEMNGTSPDYNQAFNITYKNYKYASSWKLTAVTGPDYVDVNVNHIADEGDKGYWIAYNYSLWCKDFLWASSLYGVKKDLQIRAVPKIDDSDNTYYPKANIASGTSQTYYLNTIKTSTHTAFFVKSIRDDAHSADHAFNSSASPVPLLKLDKIVLLRNEDTGLFSLSSASSPSKSGFNTSNCNPSGDLIHSGIYLANQASIDAASLKSIEFSTDYSLCRKLYSNINTQPVSIAVSFPDNSNCGGVSMSLLYQYENKNSAFVYSDKPSSFSYSNYSITGKLTLNEIKAYESAGQKILPSYTFDYDASNTTKNPDYDPDKVDIWGFYKNDYNANLRSYYTTPASSADVDAWSLKKITTPLGGQITIDYESDKYEHENQFSDKPYFIFRYDNYNGATGTSTMNEGDYSSITGVGVLKTTISVPYTSSCVPHFYMFNDNGNISYYPQDPLLIQNCSSTFTYSNPRQFGYAWKKVSVPYAYGAGLRVKDIIIIDPESSQNYTCQYTYKDGLCTYKPERFSISSYFLTDNLKGTDRDIIGATVGYKTVDVKTLSNNGQDNGYTEYTFQTINTPQSFSNHLQNGSTQNIPKGGGTYWYYNCDINVSGASCIVYEPHSYFSYTGTRTDNDFLTFGKINQQSIFDNKNELLAYTKYKYILDNTLTEDFNGGRKNVNHSVYKVLSSGGVCGATTGGGWECTGIVDAYPVTHFYSFSTEAIQQKQTVFLSSTESFKDGITTKQTIDSRDPLTGSPTQTTIIDPTIGATVTQTQFAYTLSQYQSGTFAMGPKSDCATCESHENNLSAVSETKTIRYPLFLTPQGEMQINPQAPGSVLGGSKNTFTQQINSRLFNNSTNTYSTSSTGINFWQPYERYELLTIASTTLNDVNNSPDWRKVNTVSLYNPDNFILDSEGLKKKHSAVKLGYCNKYKLTEINNANYESFAFSSFEDKINVGTTGSPVYHFGGEVYGGNFQSPSNSVVTAHTGDYMATIPASTFGPGFATKEFEKGRTYRAQVWVHNSSPSTLSLCAALDGSVGGTPLYSWKNIAKSDAKNIVVGDWTLLTLEIDVPSTFLEANGPNGFNNLNFYVWNTGTSPAYIDDLKISPIDAPIGGNVYDSHTGAIKAKLDAENFASYFEYDNAGRVIATYKETRQGVKKLSETVYNFSRQ